MSVALLFSPQGSQAVGMGRELVAASSAARAVYEAADEILGWSVSGASFDGPAERLNDTRQTQPSLLATSVACLHALGEATIARGLTLRPAFAAGHSVGEYAALVAAGVLGLAGALRLVARRGALMADAAEDGGMAAVIGLGRQAVEAAVSRVSRPTELVVANDNAPGQVVISGRRAALDTAVRLLRDAGAKRIVALPVSGPFHSPLMSGVAAALEEAFGDERWSDADPPIVSNVTGEPVTDADRIRALLAEQVRSPVEWVRCVRRMVDDGATLFIECGPGAALTGMVRRIAPGVRVANVSDPRTLAATVNLLANDARRLSAEPAETSV